MKKVIVPLVILVSGLFSQHGFSQTTHNSGASGVVTPMEVGSVFVNLGVGIGADYKSESFGTPFGFKASAEYGLWDAGPGVITLGPEIGGSFSSSSNNGYDSRSNTFVTAGRAAWHYGWEVPNLDTYGGFSAGIGFHNYTFNDGTNYSSSNTSVIPAFGAFAGASYFISPTFGFNTEFGFDITNFQVGVVFKIQ
jgi:hypothetical protein